MNKVYCPHCSKNLDYTIKEQEIETFKGFTVNIIENVPVCNLCSEEIFVEEIEKENLKRLYDQYRIAARIVSPEEIKMLREKYELSQRELVSILNWGKMTINRYENGSVPSMSHNDILKWLLNNPSLLIEKVKEAYKNKRINEKTYLKVIEKAGN